MRPYRLTLVTLCLALAPVVLPSQGFSFAATGMYASLSGSDFNGINSGLGVDAQLRYHAAKGFSIGAGLQYTSHGISGFSEHFGVRGIFADGRYTFASKSSPNLEPYLGLRIALAHYSVASGGSTL